MTGSSSCRTSRRQFLQQSAAASLALPFAKPGLLSGLFRAGLRTEHVVVVAFAGGVRQKEVLETPANVPNLMRLASAGVAFPNVRANNNGHYGAALSIFTGSQEVLGIRENQRGLNPTLFEYLRKDLQLSGTDVWLSTPAACRAACSVQRPSRLRRALRRAGPRRRRHLQRRIPEGARGFRPAKPDSERDARTQDRLAGEHSIRRP